MKTLRMAALAAMMSAQALGAHAEDRDDRFFRQLDTNGDGRVDTEEFTLQKAAILYALDNNRNLKVEQAETKVAPGQFRQYAGEDGVIDGLELFELPEAQFSAFDRDGDHAITAAEFRRQVAGLRTGPQTAEEK